MKPGFNLKPGFFIKEKRDIEKVLKRFDLYQIFFYIYALSKS